MSYDLVAVIVGVFLVGLTFGLMDGGSKLGRVWKAFCRGFWQAWMEVVPTSQRSSVGELHMTLTCDSSQFDREITKAIDDLTRLKGLRA